MRVHFEEMFQRRVLEHEADVSVIREGFEKERAQFRAEITARENTIREVAAESDRIAQEAIKETTGLNAKIEAARRDIESEFRARENDLQAELALRESVINSLKDEVVRKESEWSERLRLREHEIQSSKVAELENEYQRRFGMLQAKEDELKKQYDEMFHQRVVENEANLKALRESFEIERAQLRAEMECREVTVREVLAERDRAKSEAMAELSQSEDKYEQRRLELEKNHIEEVEVLLSQLKSRESEVAGLKEEMLKNDQQWAEKLRNFEHEVMGRKISELDKEYYAKYSELNSGFNAGKARLEDDVEKLKSELYSNYQAQQEHLNAEKARLDEIITRKESEHIQRMRDLDAKEAGLRSQEEETRIRYEEMFHQRVVEHEADFKVLRDGFEKERAQFRSEIAARENAVRELGDEVRCGGRDHDGVRGAAGMDVRHAGLVLPLAQQHRLA